MKLLSVILLVGCLKLQAGETKTIAFSPFCSQAQKGLSVVRGGGQNMDFDLFKLRVNQRTIAGIYVGSWPETSIDLTRYKKWPATERGVGVTSRIESTGGKYQGEFLMCDYRNKEHRVFLQIYFRDLPEDRMNIVTAFVKSVRPR